ncbi:cell envelope integrity protein TolA [Acinetobacter beijerinckii]|uniref:cell envelope integrity protein TolA n=1 Tax=Acinetobacter beijerinckii TaxID=262668 RepID=UPI003AF87B2F
MSIKNFFSSFIILNLCLIGSVHSQEIKEKTESEKYYLSQLQEAKKVKAAFSKSIVDAWNVPKNTAGKTALVKVILDDKGQIEKILMDQDIDPIFRSSIEKAVKKASPFDLPKDSTVREKAKHLTIKFSAVDSTDKVAKYSVQNGKNLYWSKFPQVQINGQELEGQDRFVLVSIISNEKGDIIEAEILKSSGLSNLDEKVLNATKEAKLKPYFADGKYYPIKATLPFDLNLNN